MSTSPLSGTTSPAIIDTVVVLPAPFGPSSPTSEPGSTLNDTSSTATSAPNDLRRCLSCSIERILAFRCPPAGWFPTNGTFLPTNGLQTPASCRGSHCS